MLAEKGISIDIVSVEPGKLPEDLLDLNPYHSVPTLVDATIAPVLWRLPYYEIDLPPQAQPIIKYASLIFSRPAFRESLSDTEQEMRLI